MPGFIFSFLKRYKACVFIARFVHVGIYSMKKGSRGMRQLWDQLHGTDGTQMFKPSQQEEMQNEISDSLNSFGEDHDFCNVNLLKRLEKITVNINP